MRLLRLLVLAIALLPPLLAGVGRAAATPGLMLEAQFGVICKTAADGTSEHQKQPHGVECCCVLACTPAPAALAPAAAPPLPAAPPARADSAGAAAYHPTGPPPLLAFLKSQLIPTRGPPIETAPRTVS